MREAIAVAVMLVLIGCSPDPQEPRDPKTPRPKTFVIQGPVSVEPLQAGMDESHPLAMRAVLRCHLNQQAKTMCQLDVPRSAARMG